MMADGGAVMLGASVGDAPPIGPDSASFPVFLLAVVIFYCGAYLLHHSTAVYRALAEADEPRVRPSAGEKGAFLVAVLILVFGFFHMWWVDPGYVRYPQQHVGNAIFRGFLRGELIMAQVVLIAAAIPSFTALVKLGTARFFAPRRSTGDGAQGPVGMPSFWFALLNALANVATLILFFRP